jgi:hypothetical protein
MIPSLLVTFRFLDKGWMAGTFPILAVGIGLDAVQRSQSSIYFGAGNSLGFGITASCQYDMAWGYEAFVQGSRYQEILE